MGFPIEWLHRTKKVEPQPPQPPQPTYKVVELPSRFTVKGDDEMKESVATLSSHPGFIFLTQKLAAQGAALKSKLSFEKHENMEAVTFLQAGIYWSNWLAQEVSRSTTKTTATKLLDPFDEELAAFKEIDAQIERIG
jgi:hypothetical protein